MRVDFLGGLKDLEKGVLRLCEPGSFKRDPVRLLRAVRLSLELGLKIERKTAKRLERDKKLLVEVPAERLKTELLRLFSLDFPERAVERLFLFSLWQEILNYSGLRFMPVKLRVPLEKATEAIKKIGHFFPLYFEQEIEKEVEIKSLLLFFLALLLSTNERTKVPLALRKLRFSRKAVKASQTWLKFLQKDWLKDKVLRAELVLETGNSLPSCLALISTLRGKALSKKRLLEFRKMYEVESGRFYPFSGRKDQEEASLSPSPVLGKELKQRKVAFLTGISVEPETEFKDCE